MVPCRQDRKTPRAFEGVQARVVGPKAERMGPSRPRCASSSRACGDNIGCGMEGVSLGGGGVLEVGILLLTGMLLGAVFNHFYKR